MSSLGNLIVLCQDSFTTFLYKKMTIEMFLELLETTVTIHFKMLLQLFQYPCVIAKRRISNKYSKHKGIFFKPLDDI